MYSKKRMSKTSWKAQTPQEVEEYIGEEWLWVTAIVRFSAVDARQPRALLLEDLRGAAVDEVLGDVEVVLEDREAVPVAGAGPSITIARTDSRDWIP